MSLSDLSIKNPVFAVMLAAAMIVFGWLGYRDMGVSQFPEIDFPVVSVAVSLEAAPPEIMDGDVTEVIEDAVAGVEGVDYIMSQSLEGTSIVTIFFRLDRDIDVAMQDVQNAVSARRRYLPVNVDPPVILKVNPNNLPVMWLALYGSVPRHQISDFAEKQLKQQLAAIAEVSGVQFAGLQARNIRIWVDRDKLAGYNLAAEDVLTTLQRQHAELPAGYIQSKQVEFNLRTMGEAYSIGDFQKLVVAERKGQQIKLGDVAVIEDGTEDRRSLARYNRMPAVAIGIRKAIGGNLVAVCDNVKNQLPRLRRMLPEGMELAVPVDYSLFVRENVEELRLTMFLGIVLTAFVCFLFLGSVGTTLNICLTIPTSLVGTFSALYALNQVMRAINVPPFTINLMTLLGLSLSVGVVVDDAILVLENIYRHRERGLGRVEAALTGAREISFAALAATLSIMAIFLPVAFMHGIVGRFFFQFGVTVGVAVFLSLVSALTLTPMLCAFFLNLAHRSPKPPRPFGYPLGFLVGSVVVAAATTARVLALYWPAMAPAAWPIRTILAAEPGASPPPVPWWIAETAVEFLIALLLTRWGNQLYWGVDRWVLAPLFLKPTEWALQRVTSGYGSLLRWALRRWAVVLSISGVLIGIAVLFAFGGILGRELVPSEDQSRFVVHVIGPVGSSIDQIDDLLQKCESGWVGERGERIVHGLVHRVDVAGILTTVATEQGQLINEADIFVHLVPQRQRQLRQKEIMEQVRRDLEKIHDIRIIMRDLSTEGFTAQRGDPVDFAIIGDWKQLPALAERIMTEMRASGIVQDIDSDYRPGMTEERIIPDRDRLALLNNTPAGRVADTLSLLIGGQRVGRFTDQGRRYDVRARLQLGQRATPGDLDYLMIRTNGGKLVPLSDVTRRETKATLPVINRYNHQRKIEITARPAAGVSQGEAIAQCRAIAERHLPSDKFSMVELGNAQAMQETMQSLIFALVLGIVIAYMILGVQFNSFYHPFTVLLAMPFAATGALATLWLTGDSLNMMSMIGLILLMGLVKKNSIILVDYTNTLRDTSGGTLSPEEAVLEACPIRLRPILMTSMATVAGALPAALGVGPGAETRAPMARGIIGGIIVSTLVTLILVPVIYVLIERLLAQRSRLLAPAEDTEIGSVLARTPPSPAETTVP
jgi:multidrug efflux pump subunit AcrB